MWIYLILSCQKRIITQASEWSYQILPVSDKNTNSSKTPSVYGIKNIKHKMHFNTKVIKRHKVDILTK